MRTRSFQAYLEKRLSPEEIAEVKEQARLEVKYIRAIQSALSDSMDEYMKKNKVGFNELVRRLGSSPSHVAKIQRGEANLTVSSLAHILAMLGKEPNDIFKRIK
jgi:transcriptional regulator with XRE-family HTH domain